MTDSSLQYELYDENIHNRKGVNAVAVSHLPDRHDIPGITIGEFPSCKPNEKIQAPLRIAGHLKQVLEAAGEGCPASLRIPSSLELSGFYGCSVLDVLDGLFELKKQGYEYVMNGLDGEIILHDPLCRKKPKKVLRLLPHDFLQAWNSIQKAEGT